jgi:hypothetical protein
VWEEEPCKNVRKMRQGEYQMWVPKIKNSSDIFCFYFECYRTISKIGVKRPIHKFVSNFIALLPENNPGCSHACIIFLSAINVVMNTINKRKGEIVHASN